MHNEKPNPYTQDSHDAGPEKKSTRTPFRRAVRTMVKTIAIMGAVFVVISAVIFIESVIKREPIEDFWAAIGDEPWALLIFAGTLPVLAGNRDDRGCCCCISRLIRRKKSARHAAEPTRQT